MAHKYNPWVGTGNPDTYVEAPQSPVSTMFPQNQGERGEYFEYQRRTYVRVQHDSGATSATPTGVVAANQLAFWKDKTRWVVTNDSRFSELAGANNSFRNSVAGIYRSAVPAGYDCLILTRGLNIPVK